MKLFDRLFAILLCLVFLSGLIGIPITMGAGTPHSINGYVRDLGGNPVWDATVYVNNTRTSESLDQQTDEFGRYSIDIDSYPSGYNLSDVLNVTAVYYQYLDRNNVTVTPDPAQQVDLALAMYVHTVEGNVSKPDGSPANHFSVNITNQDKNETHFAITNKSGHFRMDLSHYLNGYSVNDDITASVLFNGFTGSNSSIVTANHTDYVDVHLADIEPPTLSVSESPANVTLNSFFRILAYVNDNMEMDAVSLFMRSPGDSVYTELAMIQDDGAANDWDSDGMPDIHIFGQSTDGNIPLQSEIGMFQYYLRTSDGVFSVTDPSTDPENNPYEIEIIDDIAPFLVHTPINTLEAGESPEITAIAMDNIAMGQVKMFVKNVSQPAFSEYTMLPDGNPHEYNATMPAQHAIGTLEYYLWCNDSSGNPTRLPASASWPVSVTDTTAPEIIHSPINSVNVNDPVNFTCQISDATVLDSVWLNFTDVHGIGFNLSMSNAGGGNWYYLNQSGQNWTGILHYTIWANDTSGNLASISHAAAVNDAGTPLIFHDAPAYLDYNVSSNITAYVEDDVNIASISLAYEPVGGGGFTVIPMNSWDSTGKHGNFSAIIPAQNLGTMRYYINASDGTNNISWPAIGPPHAIDILDTEPPAISPGPYASIRTSPGDVSLNANVTDNHLVDEVIIHYLNSTSQFWNNVSMTPANVDATGSGMYVGVIPGQVDDTVRFYFSANDTSGNMATSPAYAPKLNPYDLIFLDYSEPMVEIYSPASSGVNRTTDIIVNATDDQGIASVQLYYNGTEDDGFTQLSLSMLENGTYRGILPPQNHSGIIQVYAMASDGQNSNVSRISTVTVINQPPEIQHIGVESAPVGENVAMVAQVTDDLHVENVILSWRPIGDSQYSNLTMGQPVFGTYRADLAFDDAVIIQYHITAFDAENSTVWPTGSDHEIRIMDLEAPVIIHNPISVLNISSRPIITAQVTDNQQVSSVQVWYRNASASTFFSASMTPVSNMPDAYTVVLEQQPEGNFTYYIRATDGVNTAVTSNYTVEVHDNSGTDWAPAIMVIIVIILMVIAIVLVIVYLRRKPIKEEVNPPEK